MFMIANSIYRFVKPVLIVFLTIYMLNSEAFSNPIQNQSDKNHYSERIALFTDRDIYMAGEDIWFKAIIRNKELIADTCISNILFVELFNENNKFIIRQKIEIRDNYSQSKITIPENFATGRYYLRVSTNFQKNYPFSSLTIKTIRIINPSKKAASEYLSNFKSKVYFNNGKAINNLNNIGVIQFPEYYFDSISAAYITGNNDSIAEINYYKNGYGYFNLIPHSSAKYEVNLKLLSGEILKTPITQIHKSGYLLSSTINGKKLTLKAYKSKQLTTLNQRLAIYDGYGELIHSSEIEWQSDSLMIVLEKNMFSEGLYYFLLLDKNDQIICLHNNYFKNPARAEKLIIKSEKSIYSSRDSVNLEIIYNGNDKEEFVSGVLSVIQKGTYDISSEKQIFSESSGINNFSYGENSPFPKISSVIHESFASTDSLYLGLLQNIIRGDIKYLPDSRAISLTGILANKGNKQVLADKTVQLAILGEHPQIHFSTTDTNGRFHFSIHPTVGIQNAYISASQSGTIKPLLKVNSDFISSYPKHLSKTYWPNISELKLFEHLELNYQVNKLYLTETVSQPKSSNKNQLLFNSSEVFVELDNYIELPNMHEVIKEIIPYAFSRKNNQGRYIAIKNQRTLEVYHNPLVLVDNVPVFNPDNIFEIPPAMIKSVRVIPHKYYLGDYEFPGIIFIKGKADLLPHLEFPEGSIFFKYQTLTPANLYPYFKVPAKTDLKSRIPWFSNLLYWNPNLTVSQKSTHISFITADNEAEYDVIFKGVTATGKVCFGKYSFRVRRDKN